jgi:nuclear transport factor 2 (NTF2) superfamily protein
MSAEVGSRFSETGKISPADFYVIIIWKANRAKTRIRDRLDKRKGGFALAVPTIRAFGPFARTASRFASPMSGTTTASIGFAATATRTGSFNADGLMQRRIASINDLPIGGNFSA